jgi:hypothetical protein
VRGKNDLHATLQIMPHFISQAMHNRLKFVQIRLR